MGVPMQASVAAAPVLRVSRKDQAYHFITDFMKRAGHSPSIVEIARGLDVSRTRAKALVHQLAVAQMIERTPGAQRGIVVPGLSRELALEELRRAGYIIDEEIKEARRLPPFPQGHLPLVAVIEHVPDVASEDPDAEAPDAERDDRADLHPD
jgi:SOS-response transcriptional repressor LexA